MPLYPSLPFLSEHQSHWIKAHPNNFILANYICNDAASEWGHIMRYWEVGLQHMDLVDTIHSINKMYSTWFIYLFIVSYSSTGLWTLWGRDDVSFPSVSWVFTKVLCTQYKLDFISVSLSLIVANLYIFVTDSR